LLITIQILISFSAIDTFIHHLYTSKQLQTIRVDFESKEKNHKLKTNQHKLKQKKHHINKQIMREVSFSVLAFLACLHHFSIYTGTNQPITQEETSKT